MRIRAALPILALLFATHFAALTYGFWSSQSKIFPHGWFMAASSQARRALGAAKDHRLQPARFDYAGVKLHGTTEPAPGLTLLTSHWPEYGGIAGVRIVDSEGNVVDSRKVDPLEIWPEDPHPPVPLAPLLHSRMNGVHGSWLLPDGDVVCSVGFMGTVCLTPSGSVRWRLDRRTHHSMHRAEDGNFWTCESNRLESQEEVRAHYPLLNAPLREDLVIELTPRGEVVRRINIVKALYHSPYVSVLVRSPRTKDLLHLNDVEPLPPSMADEYPLFEAGDLLLSARNLDLVCVLDPETEQVKWASTSSHVGQHDPDWIGKGLISVFDNNAAPGRPVPSRLITIEPHTGRVRQIYPSAKSRIAFFTPHGGKAQLLPNGHWLLTEPVSGRALEIDAQGAEVWSWGKEREEDGKYVTEVLEATRYAITAEDVASWQQ